VGALFRVPVAEAASDAALPWLREQGIGVVVATPDADRAYWKADYRGSTAVVVGSERYGVTDRWRAAADQTVRIPMAASAADSLNVAVATGVVVFEAARQRRV
jgi:TrmH family RNA methyltransferase